MQCEQISLQLMFLYVVSHMLHWAAKPVIHHCHPQLIFSHIGLWFSSEHSLFTYVNVVVARLMKGE